MDIKKNLPVTLADENYVEQSKQLFSSVYRNAGWKGDYMLLANEIPAPRKKFKQSEIKSYSLYLKIRFFFYFPNWIRFIDGTPGLIGLFLYDHYPKLYFKLKKLKDKK